MSCRKYSSGVFQNDGSIFSFLFFCPRYHKLTDGEESSLIPPPQKNTKYGEKITEDSQRDGDHNDIRHNKGAG